MRLAKAMDQFLEGYFATCQRSEKTIQAYTIDLEQFETFLGSSKRVEKVEPEDLEAWAAELKQAEYASASIRRKFATLKVFFNYMVRKRLLDRSPLWQIRLDLAPERRLPKVLTFEEVQKILGQARKELGPIPKRISKKVDKKFLALRNLAMVELLFATGIRVGEMTKLELEDLNIEERLIMIRGKGARQRLAFLPDDRSHEAVDAYATHRQAILTPHGKLFLNSQKRPLSTQGVANVLSRLARDADLDRKVTPHMFRHTIATLLLEGGADIRVVQEFLGHSTISTTQIYTHVAKRQFMTSVSRCHPSCS